MTFVYEELTEAEGWTTVKQFKTLRGATSCGCRRLKAYGYLAADLYLGEAPYRRHVVAQWRNDWGEVIARVWS